MTEILHFPSPGLPCPDACEFQVCSECARHGMTRVHFSADGICAYGHRLELPLAGRLAGWIESEGITGNYPPDEIAARVTAQVHHTRLVMWLDQGGTDYLRDLCARIKDDSALTDEEWAAENYWHGHGPR